MQIDPDTYARCVTVVAWAFGSIALLAIIFITFSKVHRRKRERADLHSKIEKARADILEDGVVEGPKGEYAPHQPWGAGIDPRTDGKTKGVKNPGYHGTQWR